MRTEVEMMDLIMSFANQDDVLLGYLQGSRLNYDIPKDKYQDYDVVFLVKDVKKYTSNHNWINRFGEILIVQTPEDFYLHPYDYTSNNPFAYLIQFTDGNRIDITLIDINNPDQMYNDNEPKKILINKTDINIKEILYKDYYNVKKPSEFEFFNTQNEFWWISLTVLKGLRREELGYARKMMEEYQYDMLNKMLSFKIGIDYNFKVSVGKCYKYFKNYLSNQEMEAYIDCFPNGSFLDIYDKLLNSCYLFLNTTKYVASKLNYNYDETEALNIIEYLKTH